MSPFRVKLDTHEVIAFEAGIKSSTILGGQQDIAWIPAVDAVRMHEIEALFGVGTAQ